MTAPAWHRFSLSDGSWGITDAHGRPIVTVTALGGGVLAIDVVDEAQAWVRQNLPRPNSEIVEQPGVTRLIYRGRHIA